MLSAVLFTPHNEGFPMVAAALRILVVDDHEPSLGPLRRLLEADGHEVLGATSVAEAFGLAVSDPPDLLLSDLDLADGNGCELLRRIRATHPHVRGVAVSGLSGDEYEASCREAGYERLLAKPVMFEQVRDAVAAAVARPYGAVGSVAAPGREAH